MIFSPLSLSSVTAMVKLGAGGKTSEEIQKTFNFPPDDVILKDGYSKILQVSNELREKAKSQRVRNWEPGYPRYPGIVYDVLLVINKLYVQTGLNLQPDFVQVTKDSFDSAIEELDFKETDQAAATINKWMENKTHDKIKNIVSPGL